MTNELFSIPPSEPPLTMKVHLARIAVDEAEKAYDETADGIGFEHQAQEDAAWAVVKEARNHLAQLENRLLEQTLRTLPPKNV